MVRIGEYARRWLKWINSGIDGHSTSDMGPIPSLRIFIHPPVPNGVTPILSPLYPTPKISVKMGKGDALMCE
jgi:hypothetical protein